MRLFLSSLLLVAEFSIWTREAGAGGLSIAVEGPSKAEIAFEDRKDGSSGVSYIVQEPGEKNTDERWMLFVSRRRHFLLQTCASFSLWLFFCRRSHRNSFLHRQETMRFPSASTMSTSPTAPSSSRWPRRQTTPVASLLPVFR